jgi:hypothetical protein
MENAQTSAEVAVFTKFEYASVWLVIFNTMSTKGSGLRLARPERM